MPIINDLNLAFNNNYLIKINSCYTYIIRILNFLKLMYLTEISKQFENIFFSN